ncbi:MAG: right-handed parallel beta-helix repeat-containing protein [Bacteroidota bacterium]
MKTILITITGFFLAGFLNAQNWYVDVDNTSGTYNGNSWATAFQDVQDGIDAAYNAGGGDVWVAEGTYYIYSSSASNTVMLKPGVYLYGGFTGTETLLNQRDWENNVTILDGHQYSGSSNQVEHVVTANQSVVSSIWTDGLIDGFTVTGGNSEIPVKAGNSKATNPQDIINSNGAGAGAGILLFQAAPAVSNCIITGNSAGKAGGIYTMYTDTWPITSANPVNDITNCTIEGNHAQMRGAGMQCDLATHPNLVKCKFLNNVCDAKGGGLYLDFGCSPSITNCLFADNTAMRAAGVGADGSSQPVLVNCTVTGNFCRDVGAGIYTGSYGIDMGSANIPVLVNCIVYDNETEWGGPADLRIWHVNTFDISFSDIGTGFTSFGTGNIQADPLFVNPGAGDYHLQAGSPCVDAGTAAGAPAGDLDGNARDALVDIGAYEYVLVGVFENNATNESLKIYPNPASDYINFQTEAEFTCIDIFDLTGRNIISATMAERKTRIDISCLPDGFYIVKTGNGLTGNFVKVK